MPENNDGESPADSNVLRRFFSGLSEYIFHGKLGVADVQLVDYLSDMLLRSVRMDTARVRRSNGKPAAEIF